jgi:hypothetical protein
VRLLDKARYSPGAFETERSSKCNVGCVRWVSACPTGR